MRRHLTPAPKGPSMGMHVMEDESFWSIQPYYHMQS
jgi:hypothetical protein